MNVKPSATIRQNYNEIAEMCRSTGEPVLLTKNGEGDLVVMDIDTYNKWENMLKLREELLDVAENRIKGDIGFTIEQLDLYLFSDIIKEIEALPEKNSNEKRPYNIRISAKAKQQLGNFIYNLVKIDKTSAIEKANAFSQKIFSLTRDPKRFTIFEEMFIPPNQYFKMSISTDYFVLYQVRDNSVLVEYILDCREKYKWLSCP